MIISRSILACLLTLAATPAAAAETWLRTVTESYPSVSPDGGQVIFQTDAPGRGALFIADSDGSNARPFLDNGHDPATPVWSPDGKRIAYCETVGDQEEIFVINVDGSGRRRLTAAPGHDSHPHWGADDRIYFSSPRATPDITAPWERQWHSIYSMMPDGSDVRLQIACRTVCTYPVLSPDRSRIVFRKVVARPSFSWELTPATRDSNVVVTNPDGSGERDLSGSVSFDGWPMWSPDGRWIAFTSNRMGPASVGQIFLVRPDGSQLHQLTSGPWSHAQPSFSPDGRTLFLFKLDENQGKQFGFIATVPLP